MYLVALPLVLLASFTSCSTAYYIAANRNQLRSKVGQCLTQDRTGDCSLMEIQQWDGKDEHGAIGNWETSKVTGIDEIFANASFVSETCM